MFWNNLTSTEAERYNALMKKAALYISWMATKEKDRVGACPPEPTDEEWIWMDRIAFKGWGITFE